MITLGRSGLNGGLAGIGSLPNAGVSVVFARLKSIHRTLRKEAILDLVGP